MIIIYIYLVGKNTSCVGWGVFRCKKAPSLLKLNDHLNVKHKNEGFNF